MKLFEFREIKAAIAYALSGGQSLHLHRILTTSAPNCFRAAILRGENIAHLFDQDEERLRETVKKLGVKVVAIGRAKTAKQHIDLCGAPLRRALLQAT